MISPHTFDPAQSHGSLATRLGALVFGLGSLAYLSLELLAFARVPRQSRCFHPMAGANSSLALMFVLLQTLLVFFYPRLNLNICRPLDK